MFESRRGALSLVLATAALAAGCGNSVHLGSARRLSLALSEYRVNPQAVSVDAGNLTVVAHNYGRLSHNLVVAQDGHPITATQPIPPGGEAQLTLTLTRGSYTLSSTVLSDDSLGADATLTVT